jgi:metal-responsive CopG/Arc/MetJ family transcriptional regulator
MARVNITVPDGLLEEIDRTAAGLGESRSGFLQEASARYIADVEADRVRELRASDIDEAISTARRVGRKIPASFDGVAQIRRDRDRGTK